MTALVGSTGFVGSNLLAAADGAIEKAYHATDIAQAYGTRPDLLIYAGLRAEKYLANHAPAKDLELILQAEENIAKIQPKKLVLISTIDVWKKPQGVDETCKPDTDPQQAYGFHRYQLEQWAREYDPSALIVRLPGLFGRNIKKNFIYDYMHVIPYMLHKCKMEELAEQDPGLSRYYEVLDHGFYRVKELSDTDKSVLRDRFQKLGFTALHFTDSRSSYQFYNLAHLWRDIQTALDAGIRVWHPATEPVSAGEVYEYLTGEIYVNILDAAVAAYDFRTVYGELFGGTDGYICGKEVVLREIGEFVANAG